MVQFLQRRGIQQFVLVQGTWFRFWDLKVSSFEFETANGSALGQDTANLTGVNVVDVVAAP